MNKAAKTIATMGQALPQSNGEQTMAAAHVQKLMTGQTNYGYGPHSTHQGPKCPDGTQSYYDEVTTTYRPSLTQSILNSCAKSLTTPEADKLRVLALKRLTILIEKKDWDSNDVSQIEILNKILEIV